MEQMNIHFKIEAKSLMERVSYSRRLELGITLSNVYEAFNHDRFMLPYKVQKLSKKARRW